MLPTSMRRPAALTAAAVTFLICQAASACPHSCGVDASASDDMLRLTALLCSVAFVLVSSAVAYVLLKKRRGSRLLRRIGRLIALLRAPRR